MKAALRIPVLANGDVDAAAKAREVLQQTGCDGLLIGRAAQGRPWIFREIGHYLATGETLPPPSLAEVRDILLGHLDHLHAFYGEESGVRIARKHLGWYVKGLPNSADLRKKLHAVQSFGEVEGIFADYLASDWAHAVEAA